MNGEINLNTIPLINLLVIIVGIIAIIIVVAAVIKRFGIQVSKGTLKTSDYKYDQKCQTIMYHLQEIIENIDYETRSDMRQQTRPCNYKLSNIGEIQNMCHAARRSLFSALKEPLYDYINNNHFTRELLPENFENYRATLIEYVRESYQELLLEYNYDDCTKDNMQQWAELSNEMKAFIDDWLLKIMITTKKACARKIEAYERVLPDIQESEHWRSIVEGCIEKNKHYIECIRELIEDEKQKREVRDAQRNSVVL